MKQFTMSMFANKEDLYKAKAEYWEKIAKETVAYHLWEARGVTPAQEDVDIVIEKTAADLGL